MTPKKPVLSIEIEMPIKPVLYVQDDTAGEKSKKKYYICPFCKEKRETSDKTDLCWRGRWYQGCQNCFMKLINDPRKFNTTEYDP